MSYPAAISGRAIIDADEHTCTLWYIQQRLGQRSYSTKRMCGFVQALIEQRGFPRPLPHMRAGRLIADVSQNSRWQRPAVDAWLDDFLPPDATAALDRQARKAAADDMDAAAAALGNLRLIRGGRG